MSSEPKTRSKRYKPRLCAQPGRLAEPSLQQRQRYGIDGPFLASTEPARAWMPLSVLVVALGFCLLTRVLRLVTCQLGAGAINALVQPFELVLGAVQLRSLVLTVGDGGI